MQKDTDKKDSNAVCPVSLALELIANKWAVHILYTLAHATGQTMRFGQLQKALHTITQRELSRQLKDFESAGLVKRTVYPEVPLKVEYSLTDLALSLKKPMDQLSEWAETHGTLIQENRLRFRKDI